MKSESTPETKCVTCGHRPKNFQGTCLTIGIDGLGEGYQCLCKCVFPSTSETNTSVEDCVCHQGSVCTMPACGLYHHEGCNVHRDYHTNVSTPETRAEAPERLWVHHNRSACRKGDGPDRCCNETVEYVHVSTPTDVPRLAREAAEKWFAGTQQVVDGQIDDPRLKNFNAAAQAALYAAIDKLASIIESAFTGYQQNADQGEKLEDDQGK